MFVIFRHHCMRLSSNSIKQGDREGPAAHERGQCQLNVGGHFSSATEAYNARDSLIQCNQRVNIDLSRFHYLLER